MRAGAQNDSGPRKNVERIDSHLKGHSLHKGKIFRDVGVQLIVAALPRADVFGVGIRLIRRIDGDVIRLGPRTARHEPSGEEIGLVPT